MPISLANALVNGRSRSKSGSLPGSTIQSRPRARTNDPGENLYCTPPPKLLDMQLEPSEAPPQTDEPCAHNLTHLHHLWRLCANWCVCWDVATGLPKPKFDIRELGRVPATRAASQSSGSRAST